MDAKFKKYNERCRFVHFRFRKDTDAKYLEFLDTTKGLHKPFIQFLVGFS